MSKKMAKKQGIFTEREREKEYQWTEMAEAQMLKMDENGQKLKKDLRNLALKSKNDT